MGGSHGGDDVEARQRAGGSDGCTSHSGQVIAVSMRDLFDQSEHMKAFELSRHRQWSDVLRHRMSSSFSRSLSV